MAVERAPIVLTSVVKDSEIDLGEFEAVFNTLGIVDKAGDVLLPGGLEPTHNIQISGREHDSWRPHRGPGESRATLKPPVAAASFFERDGQLIGKGRFFTTAQERRAELKAQGGTELSIVVEPLTYRWEQRPGMERPVRAMATYAVHEGTFCKTGISPGTHMTALKAEGEDECPPSLPPASTSSSLIRRKLKPRIRLRISRKP